MGFKMRLGLMLLFASMMALKATTLLTEMKAYDFARAYYIEDGGIVIVPQDGFYCPQAVKTPEGLRIMPGQTFTQFDPTRKSMEVYTFTKVDANDHRAYFQERRYRYRVMRTEQNKLRILQQDHIDSDDFYLSQFRALEWFDFAFPGVEIHPGEEGWHTRS